MTTLRQAAQQALEALTAHADLHSTMYLKMDAITALRAALAEPEQEPVWNDLKEWCKQHNISPAHYDDLYSLLMYVNITQTNLKENT